jgi:hypothetical protein
MAVGAVGYRAAVDAKMALLLISNLRQRESASQVI